MDIQNIEIADIDICPECDTRLTLFTDLDNAVCLNCNYTIYDFSEVASTPQE